MTNKTYSTKANARRAARKATGGDEGSFEVYEVEGGFSWREIDADTPDEVEEEHNPESRTTTRCQMDREANTDEMGRLRHSLIDSPTRMVWFIAEEMKAENPEVRRKDVINECIERGIAYYTARTQYQRWYEATKAAEQQATAGKGQK